MVGKKRSRKVKPPTVACPANPHVFLQYVMQGKPIPHITKREIMTPGGHVLREELDVGVHYPTIEERFEAARILTRSIPPPPEMLGDTDAVDEQREALEKAKVLLLNLAGKKAEK